MRIWVLICLCFFFVFDDARAQMPAEESPAQILPLHISPDGLDGPGADRLRTELPEAQFIAIGEMHGLAAAAELTQALANETAPHGEFYYVAEIGPESRRWVGSHLDAGGVEALREALEGRGFAVPFFFARADSEVAARFAARDRLWGIDQEFLASPLIFLDELRRMAPDAKARALAEQWLAADREAFGEGEIGATTLFRSGPEDFETLRRAFTGRPDAQRIIDGLDRSAPIYQTFLSGRNFTANEERVLLLRERFMDRYHTAPEAAPRVLLRMGLVHMGRGTSPVLTHDVGSLLPGIAADNGLRSLHIAYMPVGGQHLFMEPRLGSAFSTRDIDGADLAAMLEVLGIGVEDFVDGEHYLVPLDPVRRRLERAEIDELPLFVRHVVVNYDFLITTGSAEPGIPLTE